MKKVAAIVLAAFLVTGYATAAHNDEAHAGDSGTGAISDTPNAGKTSGPGDTGKPDNTGKPEDVGKPNKTGLQKALGQIPGSSVANNVVETITEFNPGRSLGNALQGIGEMLRLQDRNTERAMNGSQNSSQQI